MTYLHPLSGFLSPKLNEKDCQNSIHLLLHENSKSQCCLVNNFCRLLQTQVSKQNRKFLRKKCLNAFCNQEGRDKHIKTGCGEKDTVTVN